MRLAVFYPLRVFCNSGKYTAESYQFYQFLALKQYFDEIDLVVALKKDTGSNFPNEIDLKGYNIQGLPFYRSGYEMYIKKLPQTVFALIKLFLRYRHEWDAIFIFEPIFPNHFAYLLCKIFRKPAVLFVDGRRDLFMWYRYRREKFLKKIIGWFLFRYYEFVIKLMIRHATTVVDSKEVFDLFKGDQRKPYMTVSTTISLNDIKKGERIERPHTDTLNALTACRIHPQKGLEYLIEAIGRVKEFGVNVKLNIIGPSEGTAYGNYEGFLKEKVSQSGLSENIEFMGPIGDRKELMRFYESADIFVLPSLNEGSPKVIPEAMACGLPIIATSVGSVPDLIEDGIEGILVQPHDVDGLSSALIKLAKDTDLRQRMGKAALTKASQFTLEVQLEKIANIIKATTVREAHIRISKECE